MGKNDSKFISIFDFIENDIDNALQNIENGNIDFVDKCFDDFLIPELFGPLNNNCKYLKNLKYYSVDNVCKQVRKNTQKVFLTFLNNIMLGFDNFKDNLEDTIKNIDDIIVLSMRANGKKLNEIGNIKKVTRERIRQIESRLIEEVSIYITMYCEILLKNKQFEHILFFNFHDIFSFIKDENTIKIIDYVINTNKNYSFAIYSEQFSSYINPEKTDKIKMIVENIKLEKYFNYFDTFSKLNNVLIINYNIIDFTIDVYLNYLKNQNYLFKGNLAYVSKECSVNDIISMVIKDYYPQGVVLDEEGIKQLSDFITNLLNYPFKITSALSKIDELNDELILWGKLKRIHIDNVQIEKEKLEQIISTFKTLITNVDYLLFEEAYNKMRELLVDTPIIDKYKLYGVVKYYLNEDFYFKKMAVRKLELKDQTLTDIVYEYIDKHDMCTKDDIVAELFISRASLFAVYRDKLDIICTNNYHTLVNKLNISSKTIDFLSQILSEEVKDDFCHRDAIYEKYSEELNTHNITDATMLFHIARYYFEKDYLFNSPYIQNNKYDKNVTMKNIILGIFEKHNYVVKIDDIISEVYAKTASKDFSLIYNLRISDINVFRMNKDMLTLVNNVTIDDIVKYMINNRLSNHFSLNNYALNKDLRELSKGLYFFVEKKKYYMDTYSLCSYIDTFLKTYNVLSSSGINNYIEANYVVTNLHTSYLDFVYQILKDNSQDNMIDKQYAIKILKNKELFSTIPVAFINERYLRIENDIIYLLK